MMRWQGYRTIFLSVALLSFFVLMPINESFAAEITYTFDGSSKFVTFRDAPPKGGGAPSPPVTITVDNIIDNKGGTGTCSIFDFNANLDVLVEEFVNAEIIQPSSETTIVATETEISSAIFNGTFLVTDNFVLAEEVDDSDTVEICSYKPDHPINPARATIKIPSGFSGNLTFSDTIISDNKAINSCIIPVIGALKIEGTLNVQPEIWISYENANFTGIAAGNNEFGLGMYYKQGNQQFKQITFAIVEGDFEFLDTKFNVGTIKSKNSGDTGTTSGPGILPAPDGGWAGVTDYQGEYVLAIAPGCGGGGGGGLVRPSLVVNVLAGIGGGGFGGGAGGLPPLVELSELVKYSLFGIPLEIEEMVLNHDSTVPISPMEPGLFENFDYPMTINDKGFVLGGFTSTITPQTIKTDSPTVIKFIVYDNTKIQHFSFYTNLRDANSQIHQSDTQILYNDGLPLQIIDPNGFFSDVTVTINEINEIKKEVVFEITFAKPMAKSDIIIRAWDPYFNSRDAFILDAIIVASEIAEEPPTPTFEEPVIEESQSQSIPKWIKNNAAWWSEQQISDSDFVSGIQYLIKNGIINVPGVEVGVNSASTEIPEWIKNTAGWWADSLITDGDFTEAMQWLVANGVIQI